MYPLPGGLPEHLVERHVTQLRLQLLERTVGLRGQGQPYVPEFGHKFLPAVLIRRDIERFQLAGPSEGTVGPRGASSSPQCARRGAGSAVSLVWPHRARATPFDGASEQTP